jgi:hypothetical protein
MTELYATLFTAMFALMGAAWVLDKAIVWAANRWL